MRVPAYRKHKASGRAVFSCRRLFGDDREVYLPGPYGSPESKREYQKLLSALFAKEARDPAREAREEQAAKAKYRRPRTPTVGDLVLAYLTFAEERYGSPKHREFKHFRAALTHLLTLYDGTLLEDFGPVRLEAVRDAMVASGWSRKYCNAQVGRIGRVIRWAVAREWCPSSVLTGVQALEPLRFGASKARETAPVRPIAREHVDAVLDHCGEQLRTMIELQWLTGMRSDELTAMRWAAINRSGKTWLYEPETHKTKWRGRQKVIPLGPKARAALAAYANVDPSAYLFSPRRAFAELGRRPTRAVQLRYTAASYLHALKHAYLKLAKANWAKSNKSQPEPTGYPKGTPAATWLARYGVVYWHPHQLRHSRATITRKRHKLEGAQALLGNTIEATQIYAEKSLELACRIADEDG